MKTSLSARVLGAIGLVLVVLTGANLAVSTLVVWPAFQSVEDTGAKEDVDRAVRAIEAEFEAVARQTKDYATWDDAYRFMQDRNQAFLDTLTTSSMATTGMNLYAIYDAQGHRVWSLAYDLLKGEEIGFAAFQGDLPAGGLPRLMRTEHGPLLLAARPVLNSQGEGPARGTFVMGRLLTPELVATLNAQTRVRFTATYADALVSPDDLAALAELRGGAGHVLHRDDPARMHVHTLLGADAGDAALLVSADVERQVTQVGVRALAIVALLSCVLGLAVLLAASRVLRRLVLSPIAELTAHVLAVGRTGDLGRRCHTGRTDELGTLAREFDTMVAQLEEVRGRLLDQSFHSGRAEMAAGVLHNVRNALSPVAASIWRLTGWLAKGLPASLDRAVAELAGTEADAARREKLAGFVAASLKGDRTAREDAGAELDLMAEQVRHIERILQDHAAHSVGARQTELVKLGPTVEEAVRLLPQDGRPVTVRLDPALAALPPVTAHRSVLTQVLGNLVVNAGEALREGGPAEPGIWIECAEEELDGRPGVRVSVRDNGEGIPADRLSRLFERGYSTRRGKTGGLGLHWCANSVAAMAGHIDATSPGPGQGATFRIWLPTAVAQEGAV